MGACVLPGLNRTGESGVVGSWEHSEWIEVVVTVSCSASVEIPTQLIAIF